MRTLLEKAVNEKDIENIYRRELLNNIDGSKITSPYNVDGLLEAKNVRALLEFKYDENLKNKLSQSNILIQCLYYLKKFEVEGQKLPTCIFVGDTNECYVLHTNSIIKYLSNDINWKIAPSEAHKRNPDLIKAMVGDNDILPFVFDIDNNFKIGDVIEKIRDFSSNVIRKVRVTKHNIVTIFNYFDTNVLGKIKLSTNEKANLFVQIIINQSENYIHPKKKNILITKSFGEVAISGDLFRSFFKHFEGDVYSPKEKEEMTTLVDRLIEDVVRRNKGEFYTPTLFVDKAHEYISNTFGSDWKDKYIVWDNSCGTANLTRDYKFKELYLSTLEQSDLDTIEQSEYNPEATKFQYDFLNDPIESMPIGLQEAISEGKEMLFLINPPYATASNRNETDKKGVSDTNIVTEMKAEDFGACTQNLYAQFLYRIWKFQQQNKNIKIALFSPTLFLSGGSFKKFREKFFTLFGFEDGFLFQASHFSDVANNWGISFTLFGQFPNENKFNLDLIDFSESFDLEVKGTKEIYNVDKDIKASDWVRQEVKGLKSFDAPQLMSSLNVKTEGKTMRGSLVENAIGYFYNDSNNIDKNVMSVSMLSGAFSNGNGLSIIKENYLKTTALFTARKTIVGNWINSKDEYLAPNEQHPDYQQFEYDSIIYSLFNNSSQQSSLRQIDYKDQKWDIKNEFFWLSKDQMLDLAEANSYDNLYRDARTADNRYVYNLLFGEQDIYNKLSNDAKAVLDKATDLLIKSFDLRQMYSENNTKYHLDSWDAGYAQLKVLWGEYFKDEFKEFRDMYKEFENRLKPQVYTLGFLKE